MGLDGFSCKAKLMELDAKQVFVSMSCLAASITLANGSSTESLPWSL